MIIRYFVLLLFLVASFNRVEAQPKEFIQITINKCQLVDSMPMHIEDIYMGKGSAENYVIRVLYPEFIELTKQEQRRYSKYLDKTVTEDNYHINQWNSFEQKEHHLLVSLCPIVKHNGKLMQLRSCKLEIQAVPQFSSRKKNISRSERWNRESVLSQGKWVKIRVSKEGIYELTPNFLNQLGFSDLTRVKVYGYGGRIQDEIFDFTSSSESNEITAVVDDLNEIPTLSRDTGLLFWAEGSLRWNYQPGNQKWQHQQNHYSTYSYYFLTEGDSPLRIESQDTITTLPTEVVNDVPYAVLLDEEKEAWYEGGRRLFDSYNFKNGNSHSFKINVPDLREQRGESSIDIAFSASSVVAETAVAISHNGEKLGQLRIPIVNTIYENARVNFGSYSKILVDGDNLFSFETTPNHDARLDYICLNYRRQLRVSTIPYSFSPKRGGTVVQLNILDANLNTRLWRIGQRGSLTTNLPIKLNGTTAQIVTDTPNRRFVAFDVLGDFPQPEIAESVENQNLHADHSIDMVIVVPQSGKLTAQAERLAEIHRKRDSLRVKVVKAGDLYNEFSSGTPDASAYRRYLKMLYDRADVADNMPKYLLFFGKSPWDGRLLSENWRGNSLDDYLLAYESDSSPNSVGTVYSYVTDDFFAMLDDNEGEYLFRDKMDLAVGRMVCTTEAEAKLLVDKIERYLNNVEVGAWKNKICMLADDGDANEHGDDAENVVTVIEQTSNECYNLNKIYWDSYSRTPGATGYTYPIVTELTKKQMNEGALIFNYTGHGAPDQISHEKSLLLNDFKTINSPNMPLWVLASCEIDPYDARHENLAETSLLLERGGAIAFMCASRAVYATQNNAINRAFMKHVLSSDLYGKRITMGEALRKAKVEMITQQSDLSINKHKYVLLGDPALSLAFPTGGIVLDSINNTALTRSSYLQLSAGEVVTFSGYVCSEGSATNIDTNFNGSISAEIFDREERKSCKDNDGSCVAAGVAPLSFYDRSRTIYKGQHTVKNGRFSFTMVIPRDISYSTDSAKISLYAVSDDKQMERHGMSKAFYLNGTSLSALNDTIPPKVVAYINSIENVENSVVNGNATLIVDITDDCGVNVLGTATGHDIELLIDDNYADVISLNNYFTYDFGSYQKGQVVYPLNQLTPGVHNLTLRVWDVNNNVTTTRLRFYVSSAATTQRPNLFVTQNPASSNTSFITYFNGVENQENEVVYEIYNIQGKKIFVHRDKVSASTNSHIYNWNLAGMNLQPITDGIYIVRARIENIEGSQECPIQKIIVKRP